MLWRSVGALTRSLVRPLGVSTKRQVLFRVTASIPTVQDNRLVHHQASLPRFPVPPLPQTLDKFLRTVRPLLSEDEFKHAQKLVTDFQKPESTAHKLQSLLEQRADKTENWLSEWWMNVAYLEFRMPVTIHVSPGIILPNQNFNGIEGQVRTAAKMISGALDYKGMLDRQEISVDKLGGKPLCMAQYYLMLSTCRVPADKRDGMVTYPRDHPKAPKHITVVHNNHYFTVPVYGTDGSPLTTQQLMEQLNNVINQSQTPGPPVGVLATDNRDNWCKAYSTMCKDKQNQRHLEEIQDSIVVLCLDQTAPNDTRDQFSNALYQCNNGSGSKLNSANRWPDKTLQLIVGRDGTIGANYEHATAEGPPVLSIMEHIMGFVKKDVPDEPASPGPQSPRRLDFSISADVSDMIASSSQALDSTISDLNMLAFKFDGFGKNVAKANKLSPDAFIQVAFQLAYYKLYGHSTATYESGSLRRFIRGRTDTIRSCTNESHAYCQAMVNPSATTGEKVQKLREAVNAHRKYTDEVVNGQGIDRHFLGLKLTAIENSMDLPKLFMDPVFESSCYWKISTSQVASPSGGLLCFAPVVPDGYGICYNPMEESLLFAISSWNSCPSTDAAKLRDSLQEVLMDTQNMLAQAKEANL